MAYRLLLINTLFWASFALPNFLYFDLVPMGGKALVCHISKRAYYNYFAYFVNPVLYFALPLIIFISLAVRTQRNLRLLRKTTRIKRIERQMTSVSCPARPSEATTLSNSI